MRYSLVLFLLLTSLPSCKSLKPFPPDDHKTSGRWLQIDRGDFGYSSRLVVTDTELVSEQFERACRGRREGEHLLKQQSRLLLSPENSRWFWGYVNRSKIDDWSDDDMPPSTDHPALTYRKEGKEIHLSSHGTIVSASRFFELNKKIGELEQRAQAESLPANSIPAR